MKREDFVNVAEKALDSLPEEFRIGMHATKTASAAFPRSVTPCFAALTLATNPQEENHK